MGRDDAASAGFAGATVPEGESSEGLGSPRLRDSAGSRIHRWLLTFSASAALHVTALGLALLAAGAGAAPPIFVDLVAELEGEAAREAGSSTTSAAATERARTAGPRLRVDRTERVVGALPPLPASTQTRPIMAEPAPPPKPELAPETPPKTEPEPSTLAAPIARTPDPDGPSAPAGPAAPTGPLVSEGAEPRGEGSATSTAAASGGDAGPSASGAANALAAATRGAGEGRGGIPPEYAPYLRRFRRRLQESLEYPRAARRQGLSGRVELEVLLEPSGRIDAVRVISSSSHAVLDDAALEAVRRLEPEPLPETLPRRALRIRLPLGFELE